MQGTTRRWVDQLAWSCCTALVVLSLLGLALLGQMPGEVAGWLVPPAVPGRGAGVRGPPGHRCGRRGAIRCGRWRQYLAASWRPVLLRSLLLWGLWAWSGEWGWAWLRLVPWALWLWRGVGVGWPRGASRRGCGSGVASGVVADAAAGAARVSGGGAEPAAHGGAGRGGLALLGLGCRASASRMSPGSQWPGRRMAATRRPCVGTSR